MALREALGDTDEVGWGVGVVGGVGFGVGLGVEEFRVGDPEGGGVEGDVDVGGGGKASEFGCESEERWVVG